MALGEGDAPGCHVTCPARLIPKPCGYPPPKKNPKQFHSFLGPYLNLHAGQEQGGWRELRIKVASLQQLPQATTRGRNAAASGGRDPRSGRHQASKLRARRRLGAHHGPTAASFWPQLCSRNASPCTASVYYPSTAAAGPMTHLEIEVHGPARRRCRRASSLRSSGRRLMRCSRRQRRCRLPRLRLSAGAPHASSRWCGGGGRACDRHACPLRCSQTSRADGGRGGGDCGDRLRP